MGPKVMLSFCSDEVLVDELAASLDLTDIKIATTATIKHAIPMQNNAMETHLLRLRKLPLLASDGFEYAIEVAGVSVT